MDHFVRELTSFTCRGATLGATIDGGDRTTGLLMVTGIWMQWIYQIQSLAGTFITPV